MSSRINTCSADTKSKALRWIFLIAFSISELEVLEWADCWAIDKLSMRFFTAPINQVMRSSFWLRLIVWYREVEVCFWRALDVFWLSFWNAFKIVSVDWDWRVHRSKNCPWTIFESAWLSKVWFLTTSRTLWDWSWIVDKLSATSCWEMDRALNFCSKSRWIIWLCFWISVALCFLTSSIDSLMYFAEAFSVAESAVTSLWTFNVNGLIRVSTAVSIVCAIRAWISNGIWRVVWL